MDIVETEFVLRLFTFELFRQFNLIGCGFRVIIHENLMVKRCRFPKDDE